MPKRNKIYFTFREELARTHWLFSGISTHTRAKSMRRMMYAAIPFQFDMEVSKEVISHLGEMQRHALSDDYRGQNWTDPTALQVNVRMPETFAESTFWHMPVGILWAETQVVDGYQYGLLYTYSVAADTAVPDPDLIRRLDMPEEHVSQQGVVFGFLKMPDHDDVLVTAGRFACGEYLAAAANLQSVDLDKVNVKFSTTAEWVSNWSELGPAVDLLMNVDRARRLGTTELSRRSICGMATVLPVMSIFNARPVRYTYNHTDGYQQTLDFAGEKFPFLGDKLVQIDLSLRKSIRIAYDDAVTTGRRKALEFVRGYYITRKNGVKLPRDEWKWVECHMRGDPSLGISNRAYEFMRSKSS